VIDTVYILFGCASHAHGGAAMPSLIRLLFMFEVQVDVPGLSIVSHCNILELVLSRTSEKESKTTVIPKIW
jgi:hypothetical protein